MGLILDRSVLIAGERRGGSIEDILYQAKVAHGDSDIGLSAISVVELTHGIYRARTEVDREMRLAYTGEALHALIVYPVTLQIAQLAGRVEGSRRPKATSSPSKTS
jgi:tRNA(fMet)-specific endonuclease VapC